MENRAKLKLKKLSELHEEEIKLAIKQLTKYIKARLKVKSLWDMTKTGAHGQKNLGMDAIDYYVGEAIIRLWNPEGWDWKFEKFTLAEQLIRIANKLISYKVESYKNMREQIPYDTEYNDQLHSLSDQRKENYNNDFEDRCKKLEQIAFEVSQDDEDLFYFTMLFFENKSYNDIAAEMGIEIKKVYNLRKKLFRRLYNYKTELQES